MKMYLGACVVLTWAALTAIAYLWVHAATRPIPATRWQEGDDGVQPWDERSVTLASGRPFVIVASTPAHELYFPKSWTH